MGVRVKGMALGVVLAIAALSYALATSQQSDSAVPDAGIRAAGTLSRVPLQFTAPVLGSITTIVGGTTDLYDLGDAAFGTQIVRWVRARGGVPPHRFTSDHTNSEFPPTGPTGASVSLADAVKDLPSSVQPDPTTSELLLTGRLQGVIGVPASIGTVPLQFDVSVSDSASGTSSNSLTRKFQLTMVDASTFKFARDVLNGASTYHSYFDVVDVIAGAPPFTFGVSSSNPITLTDSANNTIQLNAVAAGKNLLLIDQMGLFINTKSGAITGRPLLSGTLLIPMTCTDSAGAVARSRDKQSSGQVITINISPSPHTSSQFFSTAVTVGGDTKTGGKDVIKYAGLANIGDTLATLNQSKVTLSIGGYTSPEVTMDALGRGSTGGRGQVAMKVTISTSGQVKIAISGESFGTAGSILSDITLKQATLPVVVKIGKTFHSSELLRFGVKAKDTKFQMSYKFGPGNLGGSFFVTGVQGKDDKAGTGDAWKVAFVFLPPNPDKFGNAKTAVVGIGTDFTDSIGLINGNGKIGTGEKRDPKSAQVTKIGLDVKGKGSLQTGPLPKTSNAVNAQTSIKLAKETSAATRFAFIVELKDASGKELFGGEDGIKIHSDGKSSWSSKKK